MTDAVVVTRHDRVAVVTLNRPEVRNALNDRMKLELLKAFSDLGRDGHVRAIVLTGDGKGFCAGADLKSASTSSDASVRRIARTLIHDYQPLIEAITRLDKPVIAAVNGSAVGIGMSIALACDLMMIADDGGLLPSFTSISLIPDGGAAWFLTRRIGFGAAFEILAEGRRIEAEHCRTLGLANKVVPAPELLDAAIAWAGELAERAPLALALTKRVARMAMTASLSDTLSVEADLQTFLWGSDDAVESVAAFNERRTPTYHGR